VSFPRPGVNGLKKTKKSGRGVPFFKKSSINAFFGLF